MSIVFDVFVVFFLFLPHCLTQVGQTTTTTWKPLMARKGQRDKGMDGSHSPSLLEGLCIITMLPHPCPMLAFCGLHFRLWRFAWLLSGFEISVRPSRFQCVFFRLFLAWGCPGLRCAWSESMSTSLLDSSGIVFVVSCVPQLDLLPGLPFGFRVFFICVAVQARLFGVSSQLFIVAQCFVIRLVMLQLQFIVVLAFRPDPRVLVCSLTSRTWPP